MLDPGRQSVIGEPSIDAGRDKQLTLISAKVHRILQFRRVILAAKMGQKLVAISKVNDESRKDDFTSI